MCSKNKPYILQRSMLCHTSHQSTSRKAIKLKSVNDMHIIMYLKPYIQPETIKIIYKIFTKFEVERPIMG